MQAHRVDSASACDAATLGEFRLYHPRAGHPDWPRCQAEARALAARLRPELEPPQRGGAERRRRLRSYATAARNYVENRRRARQGREDLLPLYFIWTLLRTCNFRCDYCDDHQGHKYPDLARDGALDTEHGLRLLRIMRTRAPSVYFSGGEPTLRKDLPLLTRAARDLAYDPIIVNTNGSVVDRLLARPGWRTWLADTDIIVVSLDALDIATLDALWVTRQAERVVRNLLLLRELADEFRVKLMVNTVIQPGRIGHARDVLDFANDTGIWFCPVPVNVGPQVAPELRGDPAYADLVATILERKRAGFRITGSLRMLERLLRCAPLNCRNTLKPHVDHDGTLFWPCKASVNVPPERINVLDFDDVDSLYAHAVTKVNPTGFHGPARNQCGASCNWAQNYSTDTYAHGLVHPTTLLRDVVDFLRPQ